jgi:hypothetical protein
MAETQVPNVETLYHGTSRTAAVEVIGSGTICPPASSPELAERYRLPNYRPELSHRPDQRCVYFIPTAHEAIMFGMARAVGLSWRRGKHELNPFSKRYDSVVVFIVNTKNLNPLLFRDSSLYRGEVAYEGVVDLGETIEGVEFPMSRELYEFSRNAQTPELLRRFVGLDLVKYLQGKPFTLERATETVPEP